jgi:ubiquinone/menaquinone biosynthesis C-methylase UbiE
VTTVTRWGARAAAVYDDDYARRYGAQDDHIDRAMSISRLGGWLHAVCGRFPGSIDVLDLGCGTGRYFRALAGIRRLVGIDVSKSMLEEARRRVGDHAVERGALRLVEGDFLVQEFQPQEFDLVYSIGVLAEHSPFDHAVAARVHRWLKPGGRFAFTTVHPVSSSVPRTIARRAGEWLEPLSIGPARRRLRARLMSHGLYADEERVRDVLERAQFGIESLERFQSDVHLHVLALAHKG